MKFIMFVKCKEDVERDALLDAKVFADMTKFNNKLEKAKVLVTLDGLQPSSKGVRLSYLSNKEPIAMEDPCSNPEDLIEGFWIIDVKSKEEAINWAKRVPFSGGVVEVRPI
ncbi:MAG: YciI family protein [Candidatus Paceibacterota bacterium]|jgi:hypothetical protein